MTAGVSAQDGTSGTAGPGLLARVVGVVLEPHATYRAVADRPRWFGVLALTLGLAAAGSYLMTSSPEFQDQILAQQLGAIQATGGAVSDQQVAGLEAFVRYLGVIYVCAILIVGPMFAAIVAGILMTVFTTLLGGQGTFRQVFAVVAHSGVITTLSTLFSAGMLAAGVPMTGARPPGANLGVFAPMLEETSYAANLLGAIDLFWLWWLISLAIGLGALYRRSSTGIVVTFVGLYAVVAAVVATVTSGS